MKKSKPVEAEVLPSVDSILRAGIDEATLNRLVQHKVAEIMAERDAFVFEPFFRSRQIAYELKRLQTMPEQRKWTVFFERYGCLICETREKIHAGNGMCNQCHGRTFAALTQIVAEGMGVKVVSRNFALPPPIKRLGRPRLSVKIENRGESR